jgi:integrase
MTSQSLASRTQRLKLAPNKIPYWLKLGAGVSLGYRRKQAAGTWIARAIDGEGAYWTKAFGEADDYDEADNETRFNFLQAQDRARVIAKGGDSAAAPSSPSTAGKPLTVGQALDNYADDLESRGAGADNARRVRADLPPAMAQKPVMLLTAVELKAWRNGMAKRTRRRRAKGGTAKPETGGKKLAPGTVNRACAAFKAALNLAADDRRITNQREWEDGLESLPDGNRARNIIVPEDEIGDIVAACYACPLGSDLGLLAELVAETGTRPVQAARARVEDLEGGAKPVVNLPTSKKGKGKKQYSHHPAPIPAALALRLKVAAKGRAASAPLLLTHEGKPWGKSAHNRRFAQAVKRAELGGKGYTIYAFRHSSIVRQLLAGVPTRVVAVNHDTSVAMIESNYSKEIGRHTDDITRKTLVGFGASTPGKNVVDLTRR